ncbi:MAG: SemiSWEET transporter [Campylobacteraceae bacterium]|jgi:MtN3 and saliva related transmembrane protein|nr:SemiSWEET transporter [Campylobacteraceae bacterium]
MTDILGFAAAFLTTAAFVPQAIKVYKTQKTEDLSLGLFSMLFVGIFLWLIYGLMIGSSPVIAANAITLLLVAYILKKKIRP